MDVTPDLIDEVWHIRSRRRLLLFSRYAFAKRTGTKWSQNWHQEKIANALEAVVRGETQRLIINIPPRYSKTQLAVIDFIAWTLGNHPDAEFIHTSYSGRLAANNSAMAREVVNADWYRRIFPETRLRADTQAKDDWRTTAGGVVYAVGSGGTVTGFGAGKMRPPEDKRFGGAIIIDDPHKADEARSDVIRTGVIDWYHNTLASRRNGPNTPIILIMQRLHEDDLAGHLLGGGDGHKWEHLKIPALNDNDEALWAAKHTTAELKIMREAAPYTFAGQYQQEPAPPEGNMFKPARMEIVNAAPVGTRWVRAWDLGATDGGGDYTAGIRLGRMPDKRWIIGDVVRFQGGPDAVEAELIATAKRDPNETRIRLPQDPGQAGKFQVAHMIRQLAGFSVTALPVTGDKMTRAEPVAAQVNVGNVAMVKAEWNDALVGEMRMFPNGKHDDQIDALADAFAALNSTSHQGILDYYDKMAAEHG